MNTRTPDSRSQRGFSLVEALIAAALFAMITLGIMPVFIKSSQDTARNRNYLHFNGGLQAIMDELIVKKLGGGTPPMLTAGWHVFSNTTDWTGTAATDPNVPKAVVDLFRGSSITVANTADKTMQNGLLGQVQYRIASEYSRTRVDIRIYYFHSPRFVLPMTCSGANNACDDTYPPLSAVPTTPPPSPLHMSVISGSGYIDLP